MNDEIKFRVKIKGDAGFYGVYALDWMELKVRSERCGGEWFSMEKVQSFSQSTGLVDKNGDDIFYDDIVNYDFSDGDVSHGGTALIVRTMNNGAGILSDWDESNQQMGAVTEGGEIEEIWEDNTLWDIEVIGNRWENPELIKKL